MVREEKLMIRIDPKVKERFVAQTERMGTTMSGLGAVIIGQWVVAQEDRARVEKQMVDGAMQALSENFKAMWQEDNPAFESMLTRVMETFIRETSPEAKASLDTERASALD